MYRRIWEKGETPMHATLGVPETILKPLGVFIEAEEIPLEVVAGQEGAVQVVRSEEGRQSTPAVLHAGGWITCSMAREMADRLGVKTRDIGKLLNYLEIKIRACELGCFE